MTGTPEPEPLAGAAYLRLVLITALLVGTVGLDAIPAAVLAAAGAWLTVTTLDPPAAKA